MNKYWAGLGVGVAILATLLGGLFWLFQIKADTLANAKAITDLKLQMATKADADDINRLDQDIRDLRKSLEDAELIERRK